MSCFFHDASIPWYLLLYVKFYQCNACQIFNIIFNYDLTIILCGKILFWIFFLRLLYNYGHHQSPELFLDIYFCS